MKSFSPVLCLLAFAVSVSGQSADAVLARMDRDAPSFHAMTADVQMVEHNALLDDSTTENGTLQMQKQHPGTVRAILTFPDRTIGFLGKIVRIYYPKMNAYQETDVAKMSSLLNEFLLLGFGSSGKELAQSYVITMLGTEKISGHDTSELQLSPRDKSMKERLTKVLMWIPNNESYPVQQQFFEPSGNFRKIAYTGIKLNPAIPGTLEMNLPKKAKKQN